MKNLIIVGAGGMGRTLYDMACESAGYKTKFLIKGFLDDNLQALKGFENYPPLLGSITDYQPKTDEVFVCSMGGDVKKKCIELILEKGGEFWSLVHNTARIGTNVQLGIGNIVGAYTSIGADATIGNYNLIQSYSIIGHDVIVGNWNRIDTHVVCVGGTKVGDEVSIHTAAVLNHKVTVGNRSCVGANSFVIRSVKEGITVFGNPAKQI